MLWLMYWYITDFWIVWYSLLLSSLEDLKKSLFGHNKHRENVTLLTAGILMLPGIFPFALVCLTADCALWRNVWLPRIARVTALTVLLFSFIVLSVHNWVISLRLPTCPLKLKEALLTAPWRDQRFLSLHNFHCVLKIVLLSLLGFCTMQHSRQGSHKGRVEEPLLVLLAVLLWMKPRVQLAFCIEEVGILPKN